MFTTINDSGIHEQSQCGEPDGGSVLLSLCANRACEDSYDGKYMCSYTCIIVCLLFALLSFHSSIIICSRYASSLA